MAHKESLQVEKTEGNDPYTVKKQGWEQMLCMGTAQREGKNTKGQVINLCY